MCIVCKMKEAGISEGALELVEALAEFATVTANALARCKAEGAELQTEEELALLGLATMFEAAPAANEPAPEGFTAEMWAAIPANLRDIISRVTANGGKVQVMSLSDIMADESTTKH